MAWITFSFRHLRFDGVEKADELLVSVMLHVAPDDGAVEDVESGEQCGRAVTPVVVGHGSGAALLHRQTGLSAVERLDLAFFIDPREPRHERADRHRGRRCRQFGDKLRVGRELELFDPVRLQAVRTPDALNGTGADPGARGGSCLIMLSYIFEALRTRKDFLFSSLLQDIRLDPSKSPNKPRTPRKSGGT